MFLKSIISILSSGNELKDLEEPLENKAQIKSSNHLALANLAKLFGVKAIIFPLLKDDEKLIENNIKNAIDNCDMLVTTGGVSMGDFDY